MLDRVREALFSTLGTLVDGAQVLDLFSGTGSLGLEALSRGASQVRFVERDRRAFRRLQQNIEDLGLAEQTEARLGDAFAARNWTHEDQRVELVFMDPPYPQLRSSQGRRQLMEALGELVRDVLTPGGCLVLHCHPRDLRAEELQSLSLGEEPTVREYGNTALWYLSAPA